MTESPSSICSLKFKLKSIYTGGNWYLLYHSQDANDGPVSELFAIIQKEREEIATLVKVAKNTVKKKANA